LGFFEFSNTLLALFDLFSFVSRQG
jgi:hypothetical protein